MWLRVPIDCQNFLKEGGDTAKDRAWWFDQAANLTLVRRRYWLKGSASQGTMVLTDPTKLLDFQPAMTEREAA